MDKEKLNTFIHLLQKVKKQPSLTFDLGLIIKEPKSKTNPDKVLEIINKITNIEKITYDKSSIDENIIEKFIEVLKNNKWIFLEIKKDISSPLLNQLKHLANHNSLQLLNYKGNDLLEIKMSKNSKVIVFVERDFIENKITYPHFYGFFGPILSLK